MEKIKAQKSFKKQEKELFENIMKYHKKGSSTRYASYDYCYGYFQTHRHHLCENMELACLHLWSYLGSWGMLRGSSKLLRECNMKALSSTIKYLDSVPENIWLADVADYDDDKICDDIIDIANKIEFSLSEFKLEKTKGAISPTKTLVTKIMLGTLGCIPAFDYNFTKTFREEFKTKIEYSYKGERKLKSCAFTQINMDALKCIHRFYLDNEKLLNKYKIYVEGFNGKPVMDIQYKKVKLIDMYGFSKGIKSKQQPEFAENPPKSRQLKILIL